jgi:hypothetical protein
VRPSWKSEFYPSGRERLQDDPALFLDSVALVRFHRAVGGRGQGGDQVLDKRRLARRVRYLFATAWELRRTRPAEAAFM